MGAPLREKGFICLFWPGGLQVVPERVPESFSLQFPVQNYLKLARAPVTGLLKGSIGSEDTCEARQHILLDKKHGILSNKLTEAMSSCWTRRHVFYSVQEDMCSTRRHVFFSNKKTSLLIHPMKTCPLVQQGGHVFTNTGFVCIYAHGPAHTYCFFIYI